MQEMTKMQSAEDLADLANDLHQDLERNISQQWDTLERPVVLGHLFELYQLDKGDLQNLELESAVDSYVGLSMARWTPMYLALFQRLAERGFGRESRVEFGTDAYVYAVADKQVSYESNWNFKEIFGEEYESEPTIVTVKAFVLETQSRRFIVILNERYGKWTVHIRQFWESAPELLSRGAYLGTLEKYKEGATLTLLDIIRVAAAASVFADDFPDNPNPARLSLTTYLAGDLVAGEHTSGTGLRYADFRDIGYVVSSGQGSGENPEAKDIGRGPGYRDVAYVTFNLSCAATQLGIECPLK